MSTAATGPVYPQDDALSEAVKALSDAMKNEETRATNANSRGVTLLSATSLVTAIIGFFAKDLFGTTVSTTARHVGIVGFVGVVALLIITAGVLVFGVLFPARRAVFGDNKITHHDAALTLPQVQLVEMQEYQAIMEDLQSRTQQKMSKLKVAYFLFFMTVLFIGATAATVILLRW